MRLVQSVPGGFRLGRLDSPTLMVEGISGLPISPSWDCDGVSSGSSAACGHGQKITAWPARPQPTDSAAAAAGGPVVAGDDGLSPGMGRTSEPAPGPAPVSLTFPSARRGRAERRRSAGPTSDHAACRRRADRRGDRERVHGLLGRRPDPPGAPLPRRDGHRPSDHGPGGWYVQAHRCGPPGSAWHLRGAPSPLPVAIRQGRRTCARWKAGVTCGEPGVFRDLVSIDTTIAHAPGSTTTCWAARPISRSTAKPPSTPPPTCPAASACGQRPGKP